MEKQNKNLLLTFIELATEQGILKDDITEQKKLFIQLERAIIDVMELIQHKYFEYGKIGNTIDEEYNLGNYDPFERVGETVKE